MTLTKNNKIALIAGGSVLAVAIVGAALYDGSNYLQKNKEYSQLDPNWTLVSNGDDGGKWYVDDSTIKYEDGRYGQAWILNSNAKASKDGTRSTKTLTIFDCQDGKYRIMQGATTDGINGHGASTGVFDAGPTRSTPPSTNIGNVAEYICKPLYSNARPAVDDGNHEHSHTEDLKKI